MKNIFIFCIGFFITSMATAQQAEIEHNSSNTNPHLVLKETDNTDWARLWFTNDAGVNKWAINAKTKPGSVDNNPVDPLDVPIIFAYGGQQILGLSNTGKLRINKEYTLPSIKGLANQVLQTDGSGNVSWASLSGVGGVSVNIKDTDMDTYITTEQTVDEDKIRINFGDDTNTSTERIVIGDNGYGVFNLEIKDEYQNVFLGESVGGETGNNSNTAYDSRSNVGVGYKSLESNTTGYSNTAIGAHSLNTNQTGFRNVALGSFSLWNLSSGEENVVMGNFAGTHNIGNSSFNTYIGGNSGSLITATQFVKNKNVGIGYNAGKGSEGSENVHIGYNSGLNSEGGDRNVFIGFEAGSGNYGYTDVLIMANSSTTTPLIYGEFDNFDNQPKIEINGSLKVTDVLSLVPQATLNPYTCDGARLGQIYMHTDGAVIPTLTLKVCNSSAWVDM